MGLSKAKILYTASLLLFVVLLISCRASRSRKKIDLAKTTVDTSILVPNSAQKDTVPSNNIVDSVLLKQQAFNWVHSNTITFQTIVGKARIKVAMDGRRIEANAAIRMQADSVMWISILGPLDIEGFRVLIKPDSIFIMNKLERTVTRKAFSYLNTFSGIPLQYVDFQNFMIGNPIFFFNNIVSLKSQEGKVWIESTDFARNHLAILDSSSHLVVESKITDLTNSPPRWTNLEYKDYRNFGEKSISFQRKIVANAGKEIQLEIVFNELNINVPTSFPFNIPNSYHEK